MLTLAPTRSGRTRHLQGVATRSCVAGPRSGFGAPQVAECDAQDVADGGGGTVGVDGARAPRVVGLINYSIVRPSGPCSVVLRGRFQTWLAGGGPLPRLMSLARCAWSSA